MAASDVGGAGQDGVGHGTVDIPVYTRRATGLVRQISGLDMVLYNGAATSPLGLVLVFGLFALILFPHSNIYLAMLIALGMGTFVWTTFALMSAAIPRIGGDYTYSSRIVHPVLGMFSSLCVLVSSSVWAGVFCYFVSAAALSPIFTVIGATSGSSTMTDWGNYFSGTHQNVCFVVGLIALAGMALLSALGTKKVIRTMTIMYLIAAAGFVIDLLILLFTSHHSFENTVNSVAGANAYHDTIAAGAKQDLYPDHGYDTKATIGAVYYALSVSVFAYWGTFLASEFKGAGQRRRQLRTMLGAGLGQGLLALLAIFIFLRTIGYNFFVSSLNGNYTGKGSGAIGQIGYNYFASLVANNTVVVALLALAFFGWWLPSSYCNSSVVQRYFMSWSFDGLLPRKLSEVDERAHTPVVAIIVTFLLSAGGLAWVSYSSNFFQIFATMTMLAYFSIVSVGIAAIVMKWRRPDLYEGSPAQWRIAGVEVLPIAGALCLAVGSIAVFLVLYFHEAIGIKYFHYAELTPIALFVLAVIWWQVAKLVQRSRGVDLSLSYKVIPPD